MVSFQIGNRAADSADPHIYDMSAQIFGHIPTAPESNGRTSVEIAEEDCSEKDEDTQSDSASSERSLLTALASVTIAESPWRCAPSYPTLYLSTVGEYLPPQAKLKVPKGIQVSELRDDETKDKDVSWATETYENSLEMDHVFERFTKRVSYEGKQCVRSATNLSYCLTNWMILIDTSCGVHHYHSLRTRRLNYYGQCHAKSLCQ
jgi:pre-rRNA-processing protein TSR4